MERRSACFLIQATKGNRRAARGLIGRALRTGLGIRKWHTAPHFVEYLPESTDVDFTARFCFEATDDEFAAVSKEMCRLAENEGWSGCPGDGYHD